MSPTLFEQGVEIMLFGMGTVIAFLTLLVVAIGLMSRLLERLYPTSHDTTLADRASSPANDRVESGELLAVITAAVHQHRLQSARAHQKETPHG